MALADQHNRTLTFTTNPNTNPNTNPDQARWALAARGSSSSSCSPWPSAVTNRHSNHLGPADLWIR